MVFVVDDDFFSFLFFLSILQKTSFLNSMALLNPVRFLSQTENRALAIEQLILLNEEKKKKEGLAARAAPAPLFFLVFLNTKCGGV